MKLEIKEYCIRCGICEDLHPDIFRFDHASDSIQIIGGEVPMNKEAEAKQAMAECAMAAIHMVLE